MYLKSSALEYSYHLTERGYYVIWILWVYFLHTAEPIVHGVRDDSGVFARTDVRYGVADVDGFFGRYYEAIEKF